MRTTPLLLVALIVQLASSAVVAQPLPSGTAARSWDALYSSRDGGSTLVLRTAWSARGASGHRTAQVDLVRTDPRSPGRGDAPIANVYRGPPAMASAAARPGSAVVVLFNGGDAPFVRVAVVRVPAAGDGARATVTTLEAPGVGADGFRPVRAIACDDADGFTVLWQEERATPGAGSIASPYAREARTFMGRVTPDGRWSSRPAVVPLPWSLGAIAWNGHGYHLAVRYDGVAQDQTRVCLVTLTPSGQPEQHPWWATPPEAVGDVALLPTARGVWLAWRNASRRRIESTLSTAPGTWGREPPAPEARDALSDDAAFALRAGADGALELVEYVHPR